MDLNTFSKRFEGNNPSWITEEELMEWKKRMEVEFEGLPSHFQTPETCRKYFDNGYCPENIFVSLASHQSTIYILACEIVQ